MARKKAPRKTLSDGRPTVHEAQTLVADLRKSLKEAVRKGLPGSHVTRLEAQLERAQGRVATIDLMRLEHTLQVKLRRITSHANFLHKLVGQRVYAALVSIEHKEATLLVLKESTDALAKAFDLSLALQNRGAFKPTPLNFGRGQERRRSGNGR